MREFNTDGVMRPDEHYTIPPLDRVGLGNLFELIERKQYFALRAPPQSGKTSVLNALHDHINDGAAGDIRCVYANIEQSQVAHEDTTPGIRSVLASVAEGARVLGDDFPKKWHDILETWSPAVALRHVISEWCRASPTPLVLLLDNVDVLVGDTLLSVLLQLRTGHIDRPTSFPQSVVLCGVHDIRHHRFRFDSEATPPNPFGMMAKWLRLGDFTKAETYALVEQHTDETKQLFEEAALAEVWEQTQGQPWLVNALCAEAGFKREEGQDKTRPIMKADVLAAKEALVVARPTHLDQLAHKLKEKQVQRVVAPILSGGQGRHEVEDLEYVRDLGLVDASQPPRIANPIYAEVVHRELDYMAESGLDERATLYVDDAGQLDMDKLLRAFATFYGDHAEHWLGRLAAYSEAGPQLILQAYLQHIVNGGDGCIEREYGMGRGAVDIQVLWPAEVGQPSDLWTRIVVECKALLAGGRQSLESTIERGVMQTLRYMAQCNAKEGHLVVFDRREEPPFGDACEPTMAEREDGSVVVWHL